MKKIFIKVDYPTLCELSRMLKRTKAQYPHTTTLKVLSKMLEKVANAKESRRIFETMVKNSDLISEDNLKIGKKYRWNVRESFFDIDNLREFVINNSIATEFGMKKGTKIHKKVEVVHEIPKMEVEILSIGFNPLAAFSLEDLMHEIKNRGFAVHIRLN